MTATADGLRTDSRPRLAAPARTVPVVVVGANRAGRAAAAAVSRLLRDA